MPAHCVPTKDVIKYFDIDIEFLKSIAYFDKEINDGLPKQMSFTWKIQINNNY